MVGDHTLDIQAGKSGGHDDDRGADRKDQRAEFERAGADTVLENATEICGLLEI